MARFLPILAKFGLFADATDRIDVFDLRLARIGQREGRMTTQDSAFRNQPSQTADAALS